MDTTTPESRRPQLPHLRPAFAVDGRSRDCTGGKSRWWWSLKAWDAASPPPPAGHGESQTLWNLWLVVACLSFPTLVFVSGVYRPPIAFVSSFSSEGWTTSEQQQQQHQERVADGTPTPLAFLSDSTASHLQSIVAPSPSPTPGEKLSSAVLHDAAAPAPSPTSAAGRSFVTQLHNASMATSPSPSSDVGAHDDMLLGGLLSPGLNEGSCLSRYQSYAYRKASPHKPSPYLLQRLREYETLHRRCGPLTRSYKRSLRLLNTAGVGGAHHRSCSYVVWKPQNGMGNRMLSMTATFLYALLSKRVLLVESSTDLAGVFCQPFSGSTWLLPQSFPLRHLPFGKEYQWSYGNLLRTNRTNADRRSTPGLIYAHLSNDYDDYDKRFYCEDDQLVLETFPWMVLMSDQYFVPALFLNAAFERELVRMFPEKEAVFHHLGRYLFHPSNDVWGLVTGYYRDHLATAKETLGIQIRVFDNKVRPFDLILHQILNCTLSKELLPDVDRRLRATSTTGARPSKAVFLASLHSVFYDKMKKMYSEHPTTNGKTISFHQASHEEEQQTGRAEHDKKALAEMYLLSLTDALVTSSWSTFGYVAQGLAGLTPWVLRGPVHDSVPNPACVRDFSPEPCFHFPPNYDCTSGKHVDTAKLLLYTRHCMDFWNGVKLVDVRQ